MASKRKRRDAESTLLDKRLVRSSPTYALKGEWVVCERGHKIVCFAHDVKRGDPFDETALIDWQIEPPQRGEKEHPCQCGARFFAGTQFHFEDGWRV